MFQPHKRRKLTEELGASSFSWGEFLQMGNLDLDLPPKRKTGICTIMYTSGTTGEPKGVIFKNEAFMAGVLSVDQILLLTDKVINVSVRFFSICHVSRMQLELPVKENLAPDLWVNISKLPLQHQEIILRIVVKVLMNSARCQEKELLLEGIMWLEDLPLYKLPSW